MMLKQPCLRPACLVMDLCNCVLARAAVAVF
jgi:hypothetical protein